MIIFYLSLFVVTGIALWFWLKADINLKTFFFSTNKYRRKKQNGKLTTDTVVTDEVYSVRNYYEKTKVVVPCSHYTNAKKKMLLI